MAAATARVGRLTRLGLLFLFGLVLLAACVLPFAHAAPSTICPLLTATVPRGGSITLDMSLCDGAPDGGMSGPIAPFAAHGTAFIGPNAFGVQRVTYAHGGDEATSDTVLLEDNFLGVVTFRVSIVPGPYPVVVTPGQLPPFVAGTPFSQVLSASGGTAPYAFALEAGSTLPPGLALTADGVLSGTPTRRGAFAFSVIAEDAFNQSTQKGYAGTVQNPSLAIAPAAITVI